MKESLCRLPPSSHGGHADAATALPWLLETPGEAGATKTHSQKLAEQGARHQRELSSGQRLQLVVGRCRPALPTSRKTAGFLPTLGPAGKCQELPLSPREHRADSTRELSSSWAPPPPACLLGSPHTTRSQMTSCNYSKVLKLQAVLNTLRQRLFSEKEPQAVINPFCCAETIRFASKNVLSV